ncbi:hypothetical protein V6N11_018605 [Hibiscus sabdariffa]|uniref:Uncharacterized protein n=1 Tax=Hibiscus sabdariffa TaxID=183260 RepID=A0ABR2N8D1_9ROSI
MGWYTRYLVLNPSRSWQKYGVGLILLLQMCMVVRDALVLLLITMLLDGIHTTTMGAAMLDGIHHPRAGFLDDGVRKVYWYMLES